MWQSFERQCFKVYQLYRFSRIIIQKIIIGNSAFISVDTLANALRQLFWPLYCLFFFDLRILMTTLVSASSCYWYMRQWRHILCLLNRCYWISNVYKVQNVLVISFIYNQRARSNYVHYTMGQSVERQCFKVHQSCPFSRTRIHRMIMSIQCSCQSIFLLIRLDIYFGHCVVCSSSIYGFRLSHSNSCYWYMRQRYHISCLLTRRYWIINVNEALNPTMYWSPAWSITSRLSKMIYIILCDKMWKANVLNSSIVSFF